MLNVLILALHLLVSLLLIVFILLHAGRGGGLSDMFGGAAGGGGAMAGSTVVERNLDRITVATAVIFAFTTILLSLRLD
ncbi:MAG: preprotein translocase subunit SecG [Acidimicrobiia bacterium]